MTEAIEWLVFDLGGVLVEVASGERTRARLARHTATEPAMLSALLRERFTERPFSPAERLQTGELDIEGFHAEFSAPLGRPIALDRLIGELEAMLLGEKADTVALARRLAERYSLACYSNTNAVHWDYMRRRFSFFDVFTHCFASQELGIAKPDARGFARIAAALEAAPGQCLLIDDRSINVAGAKAAGWQALRFVDADTLAADLRCLGIGMGMGPDKETVS